MRLHPQDHIPLEDKFEHAKRTFIVKETAGVDLCWYLTSKLNTPMENKQYVSSSIKDLF